MFTKPAIFLNVIDDYIVCECIIKSNSAATLTLTFSQIT